MITFGFSRVTPDDELNALRTALAIQELMAELRSSGRTRFTIGISVHTGRAQVAHFIVDDRSNGPDRDRPKREYRRATLRVGKVQDGGAGGDPEERPALSKARTRIGRGEVWVDEAGILYNAGIVVSQDTVEELARRGWPSLCGRRCPWIPVFRPRAGKNVLLEYVGDAKFKGVGRSVAIYRLGATADGQSRAGPLPRERS